mgnify:CR=1 FL=1
MSPRLAIVGFGLIGASLAASLKRVGHDVEIVAVVRHEAAADEALAAGLADRAVVGAAAGVAGADVVLLAVPMLAMRGMLVEIAPALAPHAIVTDAGSVKGRFVEDARAVFGGPGDGRPEGGAGGGSGGAGRLARVVPGHPIAGREKSGMGAADATLYAGRRVLLTPLPETDADAVETVAALWRATGAEVECLSPERHDRVLAATSHLPHVVAFALVDALRARQEAEQIFRHAAGGFRDFTRIASSDAIMWRDVCLTNGAAIVETLDDLEASLASLRQAIATGDGETIEAMFRRAKAARDTYVD